MDDAEFDFPPARSGVTGGIEPAGGWLYSGDPRRVALVVIARDVNLEAALRSFRRLDFFFSTARMTYLRD
jgi:hypothetical protein